MFVSRLIWSNVALSHEVFVKETVCFLSFNSKLIMKPLNRLFEYSFSHMTLLMSHIICLENTHGDIEIRKYYKSPIHIILDNPSIYLSIYNIICYKI